MKCINAKPATLEQLRCRAKKHGLLIRKYERGEDSYVLVDAKTNCVASYPIPLTLEQVEYQIAATEAEADAQD